MHILRTGRVHAGIARVSGTILLIQLLGLWLHLQAKQRSRRQLGRLDDRLLCDVGIDPASARAESKRPIWE